MSLARVWQLDLGRDSSSGLPDLGHYRAIPFWLPGLEQKHPGALSSWHRKVLFTFGPHPIIMCLDFQLSLGVSGCSSQLKLIVFIALC